MYKLIRNIHLILGLTVTPFLLVYAISSVFYAHHFLDFTTTETNVEEFTLATITRNPTEMAGILLTKHAIRGSLINSSISDSGLMKLEVSRPGTFYKIDVDTNTGIAISKERTRDAIGFIDSLHQAGFRNKNSVESWWSFAVAIVSVFLIFIVVTGIILWLFRRKDRGSGGIFLCVSLVYSISVLFILRLG